MEWCKRQLARARILGYISAILFCIASVTVIDALQTLIRQDFNQVDVIAGETTTFTGNMPQGITDPADITILVEPKSDITIHMTEAFSGFWLGGNMWRAEISVPAHMKDSVLQIIIQDIWKEKDSQGIETSRQNPTLIFPLHVFSDINSQNAASHSYFLRYAGISPLHICTVTLIGAVLFALGQWITFKRADKLLIKNGFGFIHGVKLSDNAYTALFQLPKTHQFALDGAVILYNNKLEELGTGTIVEYTNQAAVAKFSGTLRPRYGWFLQATTEATQ